MDILWLWNLRSLWYSVVSSFASRYDAEITSVDVKKSKMPTTKCRFYELSNVIFICVCSYYEEHTDSSFPSFSTCTTRIEINNLDLTKCSSFSIQFSVCTERYISHTRVSYFFPCPFHYWFTKSQVAAIFFENCVVYLLLVFIIAVSLFFMAELLLQF